MQTVISLDAKTDLKQQITEYILSLHNTSDGTKEQNASYLRQFANYLMSVGISRFEEVTKKDIEKKRIRRYFQKLVRIVKH
jgi:predicted component of type VI protein secretion system